MFERYWMGSLDCFCYGPDNFEWWVILYIVISNKVHTQHCWFIDTVNIMLTFLYTVFYNFHRPLGFLKGKQFLDYWISHNSVRK
jgi:hypothetical protein